MAQLLHHPPGMKSVLYCGCADNFRAVVNKADDIDWTSGLESYGHYHRMMAALAHKYGCTIEQATAVFVSTSPNNDYLNNLRSTVSILDGWKRGVPVDEIVISTYNHAKFRAWACLHGRDFLQSTKGPKIKSFYRNIVDPTDPDPVTIDGHMVSAWTGQRILMKDVAVGRWNYPIVAADARQVAAERGLVPCQLQGVIWFAWKRIHQVVYSGNLNLFGDHWGLHLDPTQLRPFTKKEVPAGLQAIEAHPSLL